MRVLTVADTPGQRLATRAVSAALQADHEPVPVLVGHCEGGRHRTVGAALDGPAPSIRIDADAGTHTGRTARLLRELDEVVARTAPDVVLVAGDTNSTLAGALVGAKRDALVAHVEAGLRPRDRDGADDLDRVLADHCSGHLFVPSARAARRVAGVGRTEYVHRVGDVTYDALLTVRDRARERSTVLDRIDHDPGSFVLATVSRRRTGRSERLASILAGLADAPLPVVVPTCPGSDDGFGRFRDEDFPGTVERVESETYLDFLALLDAAERAVTDADRVQKEAFYLDTPCVTLRSSTPWIETVEAGWNVLVGTRPDAISRNLRRSFGRDAKPSPYGDGTAAERIVETLERAVGTAAADDPTGNATPQWS